MSGKIRKILSFLLCFCFLFEQIGLAQVAQTLDISGHLAQLHNSLFPDKFRPLHLRYLSYDNIANSFKLLLDKGDFFNVRSPQSTEKPRKRLKKTPGYL